MKRLWNHGRSEKGSTAVLVAIMMTSFVAFLGIGVDIGHLFMVKHRLQHAADTVAVSAMRKIALRESIAQTVLTEQSIDPATLSTYEVNLGTWDSAGKVFTPDAAGDALQVRLESTEPLYFLKVLPGIPAAVPVGAEATANLKKSGAVVQLGATALAINTEEGALLDGLLGSMLGTSLNLAAIGWQGLANASLNLVDFLDLAKLELGVGTVDEVLNADLSLLQMLDLMLGVLEADGNTAVAELSLLKEQILDGSIGPLNLPLHVGDLLQVDTNANGLALANVNLLSLVTATAGLFNHESAVAASVGINLGLLDVDLRVKIVEPPVIKVMKEGSTIHSAGARIYLNASVLGALGGLFGSGLLEVPLYLEAGAGDGLLTGIAEDGVTLDVSSSLAKLYLGSINENYFFSDSTLDAGDFGNATILNLLGLVKIKAKSYGDAQGATETVTLDVGETASVSAQLGNTVGALLGSLTGNLSLTPVLLGLPLPLGDLLSTVTGLLANDILSPLLSVLLNPVTGLTGISPGQTDVTLIDYAYEAVLVN